MKTSEFIQSNMQYLLTCFEEKQNLTRVDVILSVGVKAWGKDQVISLNIWPVWSGCIDNGSHKHVYSFNKKLPHQTRVSRIRLAADIVPGAYYHLTSTQICNWLSANNQIMTWGYSDW